MPEADLELLRDAAREAGSIALRFFRGNPETWDKGDGQGPVTEADIAVDRMLREVLRDARPNYGWLSEETEDDAERLARDRVFIVDPIDGTRAFISGDESFAHSLAVAEHGRIVAAVVYLPALDRLYSAAVGGGAFRGDSPIRVAADRDFSDARVLAAKPTMLPQFWQEGVAPFARHFRPSLAYRMCLAAEGRFDGMITLRPAWEWDVAAGDLIVREAGGRVTTPENGVPRYNNPDPRLSGLIAAPAALHRQILAKLRHPD